MRHTLSCQPAIQGLRFVDKDTITNVPKAEVVMRIQRAAIYTSLPHGEMLFQIIGAIAQWERSLIAERVRAGLQHARARGRTLGRPPVRQLTPKEAAELRSERARSKSPFRILAKKFGVSVW